jgi:hypothetical protein
LYDVLPKISISNKANDNGIIKYHDWDEATTAEPQQWLLRGVFSESTAKFIERTIPIQTVIL